MLAELRDDNKQLTAHMRESHGLCDEREDVATASLLEVWIDEAERRKRVLVEGGRRKGVFPPFVHRGNPFGGAPPKKNPAPPPPRRPHTPPRLAPPPSPLSRLSPTAR